MKDTKQLLYKIPYLKKGIFLTRPNRFVAEIQHDGKRELAHVHDPGRLKELLIKGAEVLFTHSRGKLKYYIKAVKKEEKWILIDSAQHSKIARILFSFLPEFSNIKEIRKEVPLGNSRIDFMLDGTPLEVKGVTLVEKRIALFPDAPTERGTRHVKEIIEYQGMLLFLIFRRAREFMPNTKMDAKFSEALHKAREKHIKIYCIQIRFDGESLFYEGKIPLGEF